MTQNIVERLMGRVSIVSLIQKYCHCYSERENMNGCYTNLLLSGPIFFKVREVLSASVHTRATGIWPTTKSIASWTTVHGVTVPSSPASMGTASQSSGNVTMIMTVVMAAMSWRASVVSWTLGAFIRRCICLFAKCLVQSPAVCE